MRRMTPRPASVVIGRARARAAPRTLLAAVQAEWTPAVGAAIAAEAEPVRERDGVVTVACRTAAWAQELDLLQEDLLAKLRARLGQGGDFAAAPRALRFTADQSRFCS